MLYKDETVWATQKAMAVLFDCSADNIGLHLKNIYDTNELNKEATTEKISVVQQEGAREVRRNTLFYNLDAIISVGYRVNSIRATQFRQWCTYVIRQFSLRGYIIDKKRMENGSFIGEDYFEHLLAEIREIFVCNTFLLPVQYLHWLILIDAKYYAIRYHVTLQS